MSEDDQTDLVRGSDAPQTAEFDPARDDFRDVRPEDTNDLLQKTPGNWRIEMRYCPIADRGHAFLALVEPSGQVERELHGFARLRNIDELLQWGLNDGAQLVAVQPRRIRDDQTSLALLGPTKLISTVSYGPYDDVVRGEWRSGLQAAADMNQKNLDYKGYDLSERLGGDGGQIQNSNSANYTFGKFMHLDLGTALRNAGLERTFPG